MSLPKPTKPGIVRQNKPNSTQHNPARAFFQPAAMRCSGVLVAAGFGAGLATGFGLGSARRAAEAAGGDDVGTASFVNGFRSAGAGAPPAPQASGDATGAGVDRPGGAEDPAGGITAVGAPAAAASSGVGTGTAAAQYGHFTRLPADSSRARKRFPQDGQPSVIGMACSPKIMCSGRTGRRCLPTPIRTTGPGLFDMVSEGTERRNPWRRKNARQSPSGGRSVRTAVSAASSSDRIPARRFVGCAPPC